MSTIGPALPPTSITPSYSPLGKPAVGLETPEAKSQTLPPVEQSTRPDKHRNQPDHETDPLAADADRRKGREREAPSGELAQEEHNDTHELAGADREAVGGSPAGSASFRFISGLDSPAAAEKPAGTADALNAFKTVEPDSAPGSLLDQRI
jgi:hypothetical protein